MLLSDEKIVKILLDEKTNGNRLLQFFKISYPSDKVAQPSNSIFVGIADYETTEQGFDFDKGNDLVDILVVTKKQDNQRNKLDNEIYSESKHIIKTVLLEIRRILRSDDSVNVLGSTPTFRNITPEYNPNYVLNRGHMLVQVPCIDSFDDSESYDCVCNLLLEDIEVQ